MAKQIELFHPEDSIIIDIINTSKRNSRYTLVGGLDSNVFYDIDQYYLDKSKTDNLIDKLIDAIKIVRDFGFEFNKVALLDKSDGTVGLISLFSSIQKRIELPIIIVRIGKDLIKNSIKGKISKGDKVLILNDIATSGNTIINAAIKVNAFGANVTCALVVNDRLQGATENLSKENIQLFSFTSCVSNQSYENLFTQDKNDFEASINELKKIEKSSYNLN